MTLKSKNQDSSSEINEDLLIGAIDTLGKQRKRITRRIKFLLKNGKLKKRRICDLLSISRPTLDLRMDNHEWTEEEIKELLKLKFLNNNGANTGI